MNEFWNLFTLLFMIFFFFSAMWSAWKEDWAQACFYLILFQMIVPK